MIRCGNAMFSLPKSLKRESKVEKSKVGSNRKAHRSVTFLSGDSYEKQEIYVIRRTCFEIQKLLIFLDFLYYSTKTLNILDNFAL